MRRATTAAVGGALALSLAACSSPQVGSACPLRDSGAAVQREADVRACLAETSETVVTTTLDRNVDILFLIDNSPSMAPKQAALAKNIPRFIQKIEASGANYHVGVATSDVGTYATPGQRWSISLGACDSFEGDDGALQRVACSARSGVSSGAAQACQQLCPDPSFVPQDGVGFISKVKGVTNVPRALVEGVDVGPRRAFQCMALVGDAGCGVEGQLEGAKRALDGHNPLNSGFLRPGSLLAVIFITDEDDCSVSPGRRAENDPITRDCTGSSQDAAACFNPDFRCLARDVICDEPLNSAGEKRNCRERDDSYLEKVDAYARFFQSLRPASKLLVSGIWTLPRLDGGGKLVVGQRAGGTRSDGLNRAEGEGAGCVRAGDALFFGRPQLRLSKFAERFKGSIELNVCDADSYPQALDSIAQAIGSRFDATCLPATPRTSGGRPLCLVGDVDARAPGGAPEVAFPVCSDTCCRAFGTSLLPTREDPVVRAACQGEATDACYCALPSARPEVCPGTAVFGLWRRGGAEGPPEQVTNVRCAIR